MKSIIEFTEDYRFLSNFWICNELINYASLSSYSTESIYQACKSLHPTETKQIAAMLPSRAKRAAKTIKYPNPNFHAQKLEVMQDLVLIKFRQPDLKELLLATKDAELIEGNWWHDSFWGLDFHTNQGLNHLGHILMTTRAIIKNET